ncbi:hypothetical protein NUACC21_34150 [Scytonema sp. NUACC21]
MKSTAIIYPNYYRVVRHEAGKWYIKGAKFYSPNHVPIGLEGAEAYGITGDELLVSLFRVNGGKAGYYIANLRDKKYYYCGLSLEDVRATFQSLGIGRSEL